jgi:Protein of unknown function (DUF3891)
MIRVETATGWWLIRHPDHARLAGAFAAAWGNETFRKPEPRQRVLHGIATHDDGWAQRDAHPVITREGKPSAFSIELVGKYSAFEEIDLREYLAVRERAAVIIARQDPYAGLLISMHTYNLLAEHADRTRIHPDGLAMLDAFLARQKEYQETLLAAISLDATLTAQERSQQRIREHFRLLQACDNLSLLSCVEYELPANLLHPLPLNNGSVAEIEVIPAGARHFRLAPFPFEQQELTFEFPARHVEGKTFDSSDDLSRAFEDANVEALSVTLHQ